MPEPFVYHVKGQRPSIMPSADYKMLEIPEHWLIFNAPRPLYASYIKANDGALIPAAWEGFFIHGIFYTACDPADTKAIALNVGLDGWVLQWHSEPEISEWVHKFYEENYPGRVSWEDFEQRDLDMTFFNQHNRRGG